jgi:hypothetical protein
MLSTVKGAIKRACDLEGVVFGSIEVRVSNAHDVDHPQPNRVIPVEKEWLLEPPTAEDKLFLYHILFVGADGTGYEGDGVWCHVLSTNYEDAHRRALKSLTDQYDAQYNSFVMEESKSELMSEVAGRWQSCAGLAKLAHGVVVMDDMFSPWWKRVVSGR